MNWWRIKTITTETGGKIDVTYSGPDCVAGTRVPDVHALQDNRLRCYPVKWTPLGNPGPVTDFFHRYVVTDVVEADQTGGAPRTRTHYDYLGDPAWHYNDDTGLVPVETDKTWSNWRGYGAIRASRRRARPGTSAECTATTCRSAPAASGFPRSRSAPFPRSTTRTCSPG